MLAQNETYGSVRRYRYPLQFYILSLLIPWGLWFLAAYFSYSSPFTAYAAWTTDFFCLAGLLAPLFVALGFILQDEKLKRDIRKRIFNFREVKREYWLIAGGLMLMSILLAQAISLLFGFSTSQFHWHEGYSFNSTLFPVWFIWLGAPVLEELAWHSYGTDCLRAHFNLFTSSLLFATFWAFWHFPLSLIQGFYHSNMVKLGSLYSLNFVVSLVPFVLIMNWLYYKSKRNILIPIIFHLSAGFFNEVFVSHPMSKVIQTGLLLLVSAYLVLKERALFFTHEI